MKLEKNKNRIKIINDGSSKKEKYLLMRRKNKTKLTQQERNTIIDDFLKGKLVYREQ